MKSWGLVRSLLWAATVGIGAVFGNGAAIAQSGNESGHITIEKAADLSPDEAERIYVRLSELMAKRYSIANMSVANEYRDWMRFNSGPYLSATHGNRYVNNFANTIGAETALTLEACPALVDEWAAAALAVNPDVLILVHGGPVSMPEDADFVLRNTRHCHGFYGASSMERLPTEVALTEQTRKFTEIGR